MNDPDERFDEILAACLDDLEAGRASLSELAARYPEYPELADLLTLAADLGGLTEPEPDADRERAARDRFRRALEDRPDERFFEWAGVVPAGDAVFADPLIAIADTTTQRRRHPRVLVGVPGLLTFRHWAIVAPARSLPITVVDASRGGLGLRTGTAIAPGATVEIDLALPIGAGSAVGSDPFGGLILPQLDVAGRPAPAIGRVVHCAPEDAARGDRYRIGLVFEGSAA